MKCQQSLDKQKQALEAQRAELLAKRKAYDDQVRAISDLQDQMNQAFDAQKAAIARELGIDVELGSDDDVPMVAADQPVNGIRRPAIS